MKRLLRILFFVFCFVAALAFRPHLRGVHFESAVIVVDDDGSSDFAAIQDAINVAEAGDVVFVRNGTYHENVVVNKTITLAGESREATLVDGDQKDFVVTIAASGVTVTSLTLRNTSQTNSTRGFGITANNATDCTIQDCTMSSNYYGLKLFSCTNFTLRSNWVVDNGFFGIALEDSPLCTVSDCVVQGNMYTGINVTNSHDCTVSGNSLARSNRCIALRNTERCFVSNNTIEKAVYYGIEVISSSDAWIGNNSVNGNFHLGISVRESLNCTIIQNDASYNRNYYGLEIAACNGCRILDNSLINNFYGFMLERSVGCEISQNTINGSSIGAQVYSSDNNRIAGNSLSSVSNYAMFVSSSNNCSVVGNTIRDNRYYGIWMHNSSGNAFFHNNLINNSHHAFADGLANSWNQSLEGNYWSKYSGVDVDQDGIGDTSYSTAANNVDYLPLFGMFSSFATPQGSDVNMVSNSTLSSFVYDGDSQTIRLTANGTDGTGGFCRVCVPHGLMNGTYRVTVDGVEPAVVNHSLFDDGEKRWIYFAYVHSAHEIEIVPEIMPLASVLFMLSVAVACVLRKKRLPALND